MRSFPAFLAILFVLSALVVVPPAAGDPGDCDGDVIQIGLGDATPFATIYYVITGNTPDEGWGYHETNGVAGLQRGGTSYGHYGPDVCQTTDNPDMRWY